MIILSIDTEDQPANSVLGVVIDDVVEAYVKGVEGMYPYWKGVGIFQNPESCFGDYSEIYPVPYDMGHTDNAFCPMCTIRKINDES